MSSEFRRTKQPALVRPNVTRTPIDVAA